MISSIALLLLFLTGLPPYAIAELIDKCSASIWAADGNHDGELSASEYVRAVNILSRGKFSDAFLVPFDRLAWPLRLGFEQLACQCAGGGLRRCCNGFVNITRDTQDLCEIIERALNPLEGITLRSFGHQSDEKSQADLDNLNANVIVYNSFLLENNEKVNESTLIPGNEVYQLLYFGFAFLSEGVVGSSITPGISYLSNSAKIIQIVTVTCAGMESNTCQNVTGSFNVTVATTSQLDVQLVQRSLSDLTSAALVAGTLHDMIVFLDNSVSFRVLDVSVDEHILPNASSVHGAEKENSWVELTFALAISLPSNVSLGVDVLQQILPEMATIATGYHLNVLATLLDGSEQVDFLLPIDCPLLDNYTGAPTENPATSNGTIVLGENNTLTSSNETVSQPNVLANLSNTVAPTLPPTMNGTSAPTKNQTSIKSPDLSLSPSTSPSMIPTDGESMANHSKPTLRPASASTGPSQRNETLMASALPSLSPSGNLTGAPSGNVLVVNSTIPTYEPTLTVSLATSSSTMPSLYSRSPSGSPTAKKGSTPTKRPIVNSPLTTGRNETLTRSSIPSLPPSGNPWEAPTGDMLAGNSVVPTLRPGSNNSEIRGGNQTFTNNTDPTHTVNPTGFPAGSGSIIPTLRPTNSPETSGRNETWTASDTPTFSASGNPFMSPTHQTSENTFTPTLQSVSNSSGIKGGNETFTPSLTFNPSRSGRPTSFPTAAIGTIPTSYPAWNSSGNPAIANTIIPSRQATSVSTEKTGGNETSANPPVSPLLNHSNSNVPSIRPIGHIPETSSGNKTLTTSRIPAFSPSANYSDSPTTNVPTTNSAIPTLRPISESTYSPGGNQILTSSAFPAGSPLVNPTDAPTGNVFTMHNRTGEESSPVAVVGNATLMNETTSTLYTHGNLTDHSCDTMIAMNIVESSKVNKTEMPSNDHLRNISGSTLSPPRISSETPLRDDLFPPQGSNTAFRGSLLSAMGSISDQSDGDQKFELRGFETLLPRESNDEGSTKIYALERPPTTGDLQHDIFDRTMSRSSPVWRKKNLDRRLPRKDESDLESSGFRREMESGVSMRQCYAVFGSFKVRHGNTSVDILTLQRNYTERLDIAVDTGDLESALISYSSLKQIQVLRNRSSELFRPATVEIQANVTLSSNISHSPEQFEVGGTVRKRLELAFSTFSNVVIANSSISYMPGASHVERIDETDCAELNVSAVHCYLVQWFYFVQKANSTDDSTLKTRLGAATLKAIDGGVLQSIILSTDSNSSLTVLSGWQPSPIALAPTLVPTSATTTFAPSNPPMIESSLHLTMVPSSFSILTTAVPSSVVSHLSSIYSQLHNPHDHIRDNVTLLTMNRAVKPSSDSFAPSLEASVNSSSQNSGESEVSSSQDNSQNGLIVAASVIGSVTLLCCGIGILYWKRKRRLAVRDNTDDLDDDYLFTRYNDQDIRMNENKDTFGNNLSLPLAQIQEHPASGSEYESDATDDDADERSAEESDDCSSEGSFMSTGNTIGRSPRAEGVGVINHDHDGFSRSSSDPSLST